MEYIVEGSLNKRISLDVRFPEEGDDIPVVIFIHGFKGFKDWGAWNLVGDEFVKHGFAFLKFNFSHNGTTPNSLSEFTDLDAFFENNLLIEVADTKIVLDWLEARKEEENFERMDLQNIHLIGHSRGGGIALVSALENEIVNSVALWAAVSNYHRYIGAWDIKKWQKDGEITIINGRTQQKMRMGYQFYKTLQDNYAYFDLQAVCTGLNKPVFVAHAKDDPAVGIEQAYELTEWCGNSDSLYLDKGGHTFSQSHPYKSSKMPTELQIVVQKTIDFFKV